MALKTPRDISGCCDPSQGHWGWMVLVFHQTGCSYCPMKKSRAAPSKIHPGFSAVTPQSGTLGVVGSCLSPNQVLTLPHPEQLLPKPILDFLLWPHNQGHLGLMVLAFHQTRSSHCPMQTSRPAPSKIHHGFSPFSTKNLGSNTSQQLPTLS